MSVGSILAHGRRSAESRMTSTVTARRLTGDTTTDADGYEIPEWAATHTDLSCRLTARTGAGQSRTISTPGGDVEIASRELHVPSGTTDIRDGDLFEITAGENVGTVWRVVEADGADQTTALRLPVVGAERPEEW